MTVAEDVAEFVEGVVGGVPAVAHVPGHVKGVGGDVAVDVLVAGLSLGGLGGVETMADVDDGRGRVGVDVGESLLDHAEGVGRFDIACDCEDGIVGTVEAVEEGPNIVEGSLLDMADVGADGAPAIGVGAVAEGAEVHPNIAVGLVKVALVVFFGDDALLDIEDVPMVAVGIPVAAHAVGLENQGSLKAFGGEGDVIVGVVVVGECVAFAAKFVDDHVEIGEASCAAEHEVFEEVGKACTRRVFVAGTSTIEQVDGDERGGGVAVEQHPEPIVQHVV